MPKVSALPKTIKNIHLFQIYPKPPFIQIKQDLRLYSCNIETEVMMKNPQLMITQNGSEFSVYSKTYNQCIQSGFKTKPLAHQYILAHYAKCTNLEWITAGEPVDIHHNFIEAIV